MLESILESKVMRSSLLLPSKFILKRK